MTCWTRCGCVRGGPGPGSPEPAVVSLRQLVAIAKFTLAIVTAVPLYAGRSSVAFADAPTLLRPTGRPNPQESQAPPTALPFVFENVMVIDVADGRRVPNQTVVVSGRRIAALGPAGSVQVPKGATTIDGQGKYLIPGLWDMHTHTEMSEQDVAVQDSLHRAFYPVYVANGVTGIREMAQRYENGPDSFRVWQRDVLAGRRVGPRGVGPHADLTYMIELYTSEDAAVVFDSLKAAGDASVKFHAESMEPSLYFAVLREARRTGVEVVGHVPRNISNVEAADSGQRTVDHIDEVGQCMPTPPTAEALADSSRMERQCAPVVEAFIRNGTWLVPTLVVFHYYAAMDRRGVEYHDAPRRMLIRVMHRLGFRRFLAGTDCGESLRLLGVNPVCHRGVALLEELAMLVKAGLTTLEALQAATLHPAQYLNATDSLGTIAPGKLADLVLLDADPLADIQHLTRIRAVVANGRYFDRNTLDAMDPVGGALLRKLAERSGSLSELRKVAASP